MRGILMLTQAEVNRLRRNRRYLIFTIGLPVNFLATKLCERIVLEFEVHLCTHRIHPGETIDLGHKLIMRRILRL